MKRGSIFTPGPSAGQAWSYTFIRKCLIPVLNFAVSVKPPLYSAVLELDAVVRRHAIPQHTDISIYEGEGVGVPEVTSRAGIMLRFAAYTMKEISGSCVFLCRRKGLLSKCYEQRYCTSIGPTLHLPSQISRETHSRLRSQSRS